MNSRAFQQTGFRGRVEWGIGGLRNLGPVVDALVIVDVLSFSTAVDVAISRGIDLYPYARPLVLDTDFLETLRLLALEVKASPLGLTIGALPASPSVLLSQNPGTRVIAATPNGGALTHTARHYAKPVYAGSLRNADALGRYLANQYEIVGIIAAGERWPDGSLRPALEDFLGAGALLDAWRPDDLSPEARSAVHAYKAMQPDILRVIADSQSGRELTNRGHADDILLAASLNCSHQVPCLGTNGYFAASV